MASESGNDKFIIACNVAQARKDAGDNSTARFIYKGILEECPENVDAIVGLSSLSDEVAAFNLLEKAFHISNTNSSVINNLVKAGNRIFDLATRYQMNGRLSEAKELYKKILSIAPGHSKSIENISAIEGYESFLKDSVTLSIDIISVCGLSCPSCPMGSGWGGRDGWPKGVMSKELLGRIIDKAKDEFQINKVELFNWTDPFLHPDLPSMVNEVSKRNIQCAVSTNLNKMRDPVALLAAKPSLLFVSLSGFSQGVYSRGHKGGDIETVKENMKKLSAAYKETDSTTKMMCVYHVYNDNHHEIKLMKQFAESLGFLMFPVRACMMGVEKVIGMYNDYSFGSDDDRKLDQRLTFGVRKGLKLTSRTPRTDCYLLESQVVIDVAGDVKLCCSSTLDRSNTICSFIDTPFNKIQELRRQHSLCQPCMKLNLTDYFVMTLPDMVTLAGKQD